MRRILAIVALLVVALVGLYLASSTQRSAAPEPLTRAEEDVRRGEPRSSESAVELAAEEPRERDVDRENAGIRRRATRVRKQFVEATELSLADKRTVVSGHEMENEAPGIRSLTKRALTFVDDYSAVDGVVDGLVRTFEEGTFECALDTTYPGTASRDARVISQTLAGSTPWVGAAVRFEWDAEARRYVARADASNESDPSGLTGDTDFAFLAPDATSRAPGESWTVDVTRLAPLLAPAGDVGFELALPEGPAMNTGAFGFNASACAGRLSGEAKLTRGERAIRSGRELLEIEVSFDLTSKRDATPDAQALFGADRRYRTLREITLELTWAARGTLTWDVEQGCVVALSLSGPSRVVAETHHETDMQGELIKSSVAFEMAGSTTLELATTELD